MAGKRRPPVGRFPLHQWLLDNLHAGLAESGISQADLARMSGFSEKHISQITTGIVVSSLETWDLLLRLVGRLDVAIGKEIAGPRRVRLDAKWWTTSDVAAYLGVAVGTVSTWRQRKQMPAPDDKMGRTHVWEPARIIAWHQARPRAGTRAEGGTARTARQE